MADAVEIKSGHLVYGLLFALLLPTLLVYWGFAMEPLIALPAVYLPVTGLVLLIMGFSVMAAGVQALNIYGYGPPSESYSRIQFVSRGIYSLIPHPVYTGAAVALGGLALYLGSAVVLWVILPLFVLSCFALVLGYERVDIQRRFPDVEYQPLFSVPTSSTEPPTLYQKLLYYPLVLFPWALAFGSVQLISFHEPYIESYLPFEHDIPVLLWTAGIYLLLYPLGLLAPLFARTRTQLREFLLAGLSAAALGVFVSLIAPLSTPAKFAGGTDFWSQTLTFISIDPYGLAAFPSFYVVWTWLAITLFAQSYPRARWFWYTLGTVITLSLFTSGINSLVDIAGGLLIYAIAVRREQLWIGILRTAERYANAWKEWKLGSMRILNQGFYGGISVFVGVLLVLVLTGSSHLNSVLLMTAVIMISSASWARLFDSARGSKNLSFTGSVIGAAIGGVLASWLFNDDFFLLLGAFSMAAPWVQLIGRNRCLIRGCCHGAPSIAQNGIRYYHDKTRVVRYTEFKGQYLHPTQVYSMIYNIVIGIFLLKLWFSGTTLPLIIGIMLVLHSLGRFTEEAYRGDPQTPLVGGLRLYQWFAMGTAVIGLAICVISYNVSHIHIYFTSSMLYAALGAGIIGFLLTGVESR